MKTTKNLPHSNDLRGMFYIVKRAQSEHGSAQVFCLLCSRRAAHIEI